MKKTIEVKKHKFEFLVLEIRPAGNNNAQATRILKVLEFTRNGLLKVEGMPLYKEFEINMLTPASGKKETNFAKVVSSRNGFFTLQLQKESKELKRWE